MWCLIGSTRAFQAFRASSNLVIRSHLIVLLGWEKAMKRKKWLCLDCGIDTGHAKEHYFIDLTLWLSAVGSKQGMLCIGCLETRIGRELKAGDFTNAYINDPKRNSMSTRLLERITNV